MEEQAKKRFIINVIFLSIWGILILFAGRFILKYLFPFVLAFCVAALMQKPAEKISQKTTLKKGTVAAVLSAALYLVVAAVTVFSVLKAFKFSGKAVASLGEIGESASYMLTRFEKILDRIIRDIAPHSQLDGEKIFSEFLNEGIKKISQFVSSAAGNIVKAAPSFLLSSAVALAATCYIAKDYGGLTRFAGNIITPEKRKIFVKIKEIIKTSVIKIFIGYLILGAITLVELLIGFWILGISNAWVISIIIAFIDFLPVLGAGAVLVPWGLINVISGNTYEGVGILILYLLITLIRNFAEPRIVGARMGINPLFMLLAMFLGLKLFGFAGIIILPVTLITVIKYYKSEMA